MKNTLMLVCLFTTISCSKNDDITKTFNGDLPIVSTTTPVSIIAGQDIVINIRCELGSVSGNVYFKGFYIKATGDKKFNISARAFYKDWNAQVTLPVLWTLDTTANIKPTTAGKYILNFYNSGKLFKSDTVQVN